MSVGAITVVGLALAFFGHEAGRYVRDRIPTASVSATLASDLSKWVVAGSLIAFVLLVEGESLASIGVESITLPAFLGWVVGGTVFTMVVGVAAINVFLWLDLETPTGFAAAQQQRSVPARLFTAATAGVTESILYQGYPIERLATLTGSLPLAAGLSLLVFTGAHYAGDTFSLEETAFIGVPALCVTVVYVLSGNLLVVIAVHTLVDAISLLTEDGADAEDRSGATA